MKALYTLIILLIPYISFGQQTYIPDDNFEQRLIVLGYDDVLDDFVYTDSINSLESINLWGVDIINLTGIEAFTNLQSLYCDNNQLSELDISQNINLQYLYCDNNQLSELDISQNINLQSLYCDNNQLSELDLSQNINLQYLSTNHRLILQ